jgi:hypothetical protein
VPLYNPPAGAHPDLATHDTLGLATDTELTTHAGAADPHTGYLKESDVQGAAGVSAFGDTAAAGSAATASRTDHRHSREANPVTAHEGAADPHTGYVKENDANWTDLTDAGETTLHSHAGGGGPTLISSGAAPAAGAVNSAAAPSETWLINTADNAVTTVETVMSVTGLVAGTYLYEYFVVWRSGATGTGTAFAVDYTGTMTRTRVHRRYQSTGAAAATGVSDGVSTTLTGQLVEHMSGVTDNAALGPNTGVGSTTEDQFDTIQGIMVVSDGGDLNLTMTGEANGAVTFKADSFLLLKRLA